MKSRLACIGLVIFLLLSTSITAIAGDSDYHDNKMLHVLFCGGNFQKSTSQTDNYIKMLEYASYLCIDQSGNKPADSEKLLFLIVNGVKGIKKSIVDYNPSTDFYHRSYTHRGWNFVYVQDKSNWNERKKLLLNTSEKIFSFNDIYSQSTADKKRDAFCKIIYYTHVLGDLLYDDKDNINSSSEITDEAVIKERGLTIAFAQAHPRDSNPDILWEIRSASETLFGDLSQGMVYSSYMKKLDALAKQARALEGRTGGVNTLERLKERYEYEKQMMELMTAYIPLLLDDSDFFRKAFPIA